MTDVKENILKTLTATGELDTIKAQLRSQVYMAFEAQEGGLSRPATSRVLNTEEGRLCAYLVRDFLECYNLSCTLNVFIPESHMSSEPANLTEMEKKLGIRSIPGMPLLMGLMEKAKGNQGVAVPNKEPSRTEDPSKFKPTAPAPKQTLNQAAKQPKQPPVKQQPKQSAEEKKSSPLGNLVPLTKATALPGLPGVGQNKQPPAKTSLFDIDVNITQKLPGMGSPEFDEIEESLEDFEDSKQQKELDIYESFGASSSLGADQSSPSIIQNLSVSLSNNTQKMNSLLGGIRRTNFIGRKVIGTYYPEEKIEITNKYKLVSKLQKVKHDGIDKLHILSDFDRTMSVYSFARQLARSSYDVIEQAVVSSEAEKQNLQDIADKFHQADLNATLSYLERVKKLQQWREATNSLILKKRLHKNQITQIVENANIYLRPFVRELFYVCYSQSVPVTIVSAGNGNVIQALLESINVEAEVISNYMLFDSQGYHVDFSRPYVYTYNKAEVVHRHSYRPNALLLGDIIDDTNLFNQQQCETCINIGFVNDLSYNEDDFREAFDLLVMPNGSFYVVNMIMDWIMGKRVRTPHERSNLHNLLEVFKRCEDQTPFFGLINQPYKIYQNTHNHKMANLSANQTLPSFSPYARNLPDYVPPVINQPSPMQYVHEEEQVDQETMESCQFLLQLMAMRQRYLFTDEFLHINPHYAAVQPHVNTTIPQELAGDDVEYELIQGVYQFKNAQGIINTNLVDVKQFYRDMRQISAIYHTHSLKTFCYNRLKLLDKRFEMHQMYNADEEFNQQKIVPHRDFYNIYKIDNHIHLSACMNQKHLQRFIKRKLKTEGSAIVAIRGGKEITLDQVFQEYHISAHDLTVDNLNCYADPSTFHRFDRFNKKYNPMGVPLLREVFLKVENYQKGLYFSEIVKEVIQQIEHHKYCLAEFRISIYGRSPNEWDSLKNWFIRYNMFSDSVRWLIQIPRLYSVYRQHRFLDNFQSMLDNIFKPIVEASLHPEEYADLNRVLEHIVGFDSVDDESTFEKITSYSDYKRVTPEEWNADDNPPYSYWSYYIYVNIYSINCIRRARGLSTFAFRPHCGEAGSEDHLATAFLTAHSINHGILLRKQPTLQYAFYLMQVGMSMSPLSNNKQVLYRLFLKYKKNPFRKFLRRGLAVTLSTDDPLMIHLTREPLLEEYSMALQVWCLSQVDLSEIAHNSVLQSNFPIEMKRKWLGVNFMDGNDTSFDITRTNLSRTRIFFRNQILLNEHNFIIRNARPVNEFSLQQDQNQDQLIPRLIHNLYHYLQTSQVSPLNPQFFHRKTQHHPKLMKEDLPRKACEEYCQSTPLEFYSEQAMSLLQNIQEAAKPYHQQPALLQTLGLPEGQVLAEYSVYSNQCYQCIRIYCQTRFDKHKYQFLMHDVWWYLRLFYNILAGLPFAERNRGTCIGPHQNNLSEPPIPYWSSQYTQQKAVMLWQSVKLAFQWLPHISLNRSIDWLLQLRHCKTYKHPDRSLRCKGIHLLHIFRSQAGCNLSTCQGRLLFRLASQTCTRRQRCQILKSRATFLTKRIE